MKAKFDYLSNNGIYIIGDGEHEFQTQWAKASNTSIYFLSDQTNIESIALKESITSQKKDLKKVVDNINLIELDYSSRCRTVKIGDVAIFKNIHGKYLLCTPIKITDSSRNDDDDILCMEYYIKDLSRCKKINMIFKIWMKKRLPKILLNKLFGAGDIIDWLKK